MKKYHYTSTANAQKIMIEGMRPYLFADDKIEAIEEQIGPWAGKGIFLWDSELTPEEELGSLIWQMVTKNTYKICKLEVEIEEEDTLHSKYDQKVQMYHHQTFSANETPGPKLHDRVPASVGTKVISPENIRIVKMYDMMDIVKDTRHDLV